MPGDTVLRRYGPKPRPADQERHGQHRELHARDLKLWEAAGRVVDRAAFEHTGGLAWWLAMAAAVALLGLLALSLLLLLNWGVGLWGNNIPVTWALDIVGYDFWIGVASGALLLSTLLLLGDSPARGALNRLAETTAVVAAAAAGLYPIIHLGRPWFFYWNLPYPNTFLLWPQFRSPLYWDAIDILSFLGIALSFWYVGMLPDLAGLRDRAVERMGGGRRGGMALLRAQLYGIAALGWRGSAVHWGRWAQAHRCIGVLGLVCVVSLQTGAAVMFAGTTEPAWHDTMLPVAFLLEALYLGVGACAVLAVGVRWLLGLETLLAPRHLAVLGWLLLGLAWANIYCYAAEFLGTGLFGTAFDRAALYRQVFGLHGWAFWVIVAAGLVPVQVLWVPGLRRSAPVLAAVGLLVCLAMWADHFMTIVVTLQHDFLPSAAQTFSTGFWGVATFAGTGGLFLMLMLLAVRYLPMVSVLDLRRLPQPSARAEHTHGV